MELKQKTNKFKIIGKVSINDKTFSIDNASKNNPNYIYSRLGLAVECKDGKSYAQMMNGYMKDGSTTIYAHGIKTEDGKSKEDWNNQIKVKWADRDKESILKTIGRSCFINVGLKKDVEGKLIIHNFLSGYDAINYIKENLEDGQLVSINGNLEPNIQEDGTVRYQKVITSIYLPTYEVEDNKKTADFLLTLYFDEFSTSDTTPDQEGNVYLKGYTPMYLYKHNNKEYRKTILYPVELILNSSAFKEGADISKIVNRYFKGGKGKVTATDINGRFVSSAKTQELNMDFLDEDIKEMFDMNMISEEELKAKVAGNSGVERMTIIGVDIQTKDEKPVVGSVQNAYTLEEVEENYLINVLKANVKTPALETPMTEEEISNTLSEDGIDGDLAAFLGGDE